MGNETQQRYGAGMTSPRPIWANWMIVTLLLALAAIACVVMTAWTAATLFGVAMLVALVVSGVAALVAKRR